MTKQAIVLSVRAPKVAHQGLWEVLVVFPVKKFGRTYREKRWVFSATRPELYSCITVNLL